MKITCDAATDTLTVVLRDAPARISEEEKSGVILDYDADDRLIAIEVLDASTRVDRVDTVQLQVIPKPRRHTARCRGVTAVPHASAREPTYERVPTEIKFESGCSDGPPELRSDRTLG